LKKKKETTKGDPWDVVQHAIVGMFEKWNVRKNRESLQLSSE
jgi:hypothetical protein